MAQIRIPKDYEKKTMRSVHNRSCIRRTTMHVTECAQAGADIATVPYKILEQMLRHPLTDQGIEKFQADYRAVFGD